MRKKPVYALRILLIATGLAVTIGLGTAFPAGAMSRPSPVTKVYFVPQVQQLYIHWFQPANTTKFQLRWRTQNLGTKKWNGYKTETRTSSKPIEYWTIKGLVGGWTTEVSVRVGNSTGWSDWRSWSKAPKLPGPSNVQVGFGQKGFDVTFSEVAGAQNYYADIRPYQPNTSKRLCDGAKSVTLYCLKVGPYPITYSTDGANLIRYDWKNVDRDAKSYGFKLTVYADNSGATAAAQNRATFKNTYHTYKVDSMKKLAAAIQSCKNGNQEVVVALAVGAVVAVIFSGGVALPIMAAVAGLAVGTLTTVPGYVRCVVGAKSDYGT